MKLIAASILVLAGAVLWAAPHSGLGDLAQLLGVPFFLGSLILLIRIWRKTE